LKERSVTLAGMSADDLSALIAALNPVEYSKSATLSTMSQASWISREQLCISA
jgi:hypothetical protein